MFGSTTCITGTPSLAARCELKYGRKHDFQSAPVRRILKQKHHSRRRSYLYGGPRAEVSRWTWACYGSTREKQSWMCLFEMGLSASFHRCASCRNSRSTSQRLLGEDSAWGSLRIGEGELTGPNCNQRDGTGAHRDERVAQKCPRPYCYSSPWL